MFQASLWASSGAVMSSGRKGVMSSKVLSTTRQSSAMSSSFWSICLIKYFKRLSNEGLSLKRSVIRVFRRFSRKRTSFINKYFYTKDFSTNSKDNIYNVEIVTITENYYVSLSSWNLCWILLCFFYLETTSWQFK